MPGDGPPRWRRDGRDWPNREASRFVRAEGIEWHVQVAGSGPALLLLHGAGAATHSWAGLLAQLSRDFTVIAPDLPGHGFSGAAVGAGMSLPGIAWRLTGLLAALDAAPAVAVGHSAGAAVLARMTLDGRIAPRALVAVNGALTPFRGLAGALFPAMARALHWNPLAAPAVATAAIDPNAVPLLIRSTGSDPPPEQVARYRRLFRSPGHVAGTLAMMAHWDLAPLEADLPRLAAPLTLLVGERDRAVPRAEAERLAARVPGARLVTLPGLGHLAHEEDPGTVAGHVRTAAGG
jgi:magnesium chelatase accessory protein